MSREAPALRGLYVVTPATSDTAVLVAAVAASLAGGARAVQYRAKNLAPGAALDQARELAKLCRAHGVPLIVNDSVELALACGADGVHLGRDDAPIATARAALPRGIVGASCYADPNRARDCAAAGADYVAIGSVFASRTKPGAARAPLEAIGEASRVSGLPVVAIGGIDASNAAAAIAAGAEMVAVISAVFDAPDPRRAAASIARLFESGESLLHART